MIDPGLGAKLTYILGFTNLIGLGLVFFSCRCLMGPKLGGYLTKLGWYQKFYRTHCWWWKLFFVSVFLHAVLAIAVFGNPF